MSPGPSLIDYLIVAQDSPQVERFTRTPEGWTRASFVAGEDIELASVELTLPMDDLYAGAAPDGVPPRVHDG